MSDTIRAKVSEFLQSIGVQFTASYAGETVREDGKWKCDEWRVKLKRTGTQAAPVPRTVPDLTTPYYTGTGHRKQVKPMPKPAYNPRSVAYEQWARDAFKPQPPDAAGVLHSLILDASAGDQSFNDWCGEYGYDSDSMKAFRTYQECCATAESLRKIFSREELETLRDMLQDY